MTSMNQEDREQRPAEPIREELQRKKPEDMTDAELEQLCAQVEEIIDKLSVMDERSLTEEWRKIRQARLQQALDFAEVLEVEQMIRLVRIVQSRVLYRLTLSQQEKISYRQKRERDRNGSEKSDQEGHQQERQELSTPRAINKACRAYATGGNGHPVYCTAEGYSSNVQVVSSRTVGGVLWVKSSDGEWIIDPHTVFCLGKEAQERRRPDDE